ncbi:MAG: PD-(D/E)XK nuclease family protein [Candidatus Peribacteraceae bacterium]|nr:PD-(D/E)XK nuclease family protein [Candidatus Peribacteraceae bacterium]
MDLSSLVFKPKTFKHDFVEKYDWPTSDDNGRIYHTPDGDFRSATTFLGDTKTQDTIDGLQNWVNRVGDNEAKRITEEAANRGSIIHDGAEQYLLNNTPIIQSKWRLLFRRFQRILNRIDVLLLLEGVLWSKALRLAGRVDCVGYYNGVLSIIDFKTSIKPKNKKWIEDYWIQATIYSLLFESVYGIKIPHLVIMIICEENQKIQVFEGDREQYILKLGKRLKGWNQ